MWIELAGRSYLLRLLQNAMQSLVTFCRPFPKANNTLPPAPHCHCLAKSLCPAESMCRPDRDLTVQGNPIPSA